MSILLNWYLRVMGEAVDSTITTGMDPSPEAQGPPPARSAELCGGAGFIAGLVLAAVATLAVARIHGIPPGSWLRPVLGFGVIGGFLGAALGWGLRAFAEAITGVPAFLSIALGILLGAGTGGFAMLLPGVPGPDALVAGTAVGGALASLFRIFQSRLP